MGKSRLKVSRTDGRRYRYPYPVYFRPPLRWITSSFTAKKVAVVARDFGPQILRAIHQNDLENLQGILERRLKADFLITKLCTMDVGHRIRSTRESCPLIVAAQKKDPTILQYMLEKGSDPNYVESRTTHDPYRFCAMHAAVRRGLLKTTSVLLDAKADPDVIDSRGDAPVHMAVRADDCAMVKLLLSRGADPNAKDKHGNTPLHIATGHGNLEIIGLLLAYGGHLNVPNQHGEFPIHVAAASGHAHLLGALSVPDANVPSVVRNVMQYPLHLAAENGNADFVRALLQSGAADVGVKDSDGNTALHRLVSNPYEHSTMKDINYFTGAALALIKAGVRVDELNTRGETALSLASSNHFPAVAKLIHASGTKEFRLEPEMVQQILIEQNIISSEKDPTIQRNAKSQKQENSHGSVLARPPPVPKISPETSLGSISTGVLVDTKGGPNGGKQTVLSEAETGSNQKKENSTASTQSNEELKRYPLRKSDLLNYQQFQSNPKQQNDVSSFSVTAKKHAERMCIVFDRTSPNTHKAPDSTSQKGGDERENQTKRSQSTDAAKPSTRRSTSAENQVQDNKNKNQAQGFSASELRQLDSDVKQEKWESYFSPGKAKSEQMLRSTDDRANEDEDAVWIEHPVERYMTVSPVALKDLCRDPPSGLRHHSKSPSGFLSEGGGLRRLKLRVAGEVPKAYTCREKASARKAFILARPVGFENVGDYDRGHLSMSSLPDLGGDAWERAMQRRMEWSEPPKPIFTKYGSLTSTEFPAAKVSPQPEKVQQLDYRISGLCPQPYKSFGKIETKTDAIEEALLDYETEEEYEIDDDDDEEDMEPGTRESFDEKAPHDWHPMDQQPEKHFDKTADYANKVTNLDISLNDSLSSNEAGVVAERILKELQDDKEKEDLMQETPILIEDAHNNELNVQHHQARPEYDKYNRQNVDWKVPSGKGNSAVLLNLLHGYHPRRNKYETMVVSSVEPEIQRLTVDNIVIAENSSSDDQDSDNITAIETKVATQNFHADENSLLAQTDADVNTTEGRRKANRSQDIHVDEEVEQRMTTGVVDITAQKFETVLAVQEPERQNISEENGTVDSVNRNLKTEKTVADTDDNTYANETEIGETKRQKEAGQRKPKKGKESSKKQATTEGAAGNEDVPYIDSAEVKGSRKKSKTKSKSKRKQEETEEPASMMQQPEMESPKEETKTDKPATPQVDLSNEEVLYSSYSEEPGKRRHRNESDRLSDMYDRQKSKDSDYDTYAEEPGRRMKTGHGRQYPSTEHDAASEQASQEAGKEAQKQMKSKHKEVETRSEPRILPVRNEEQGLQSIGRDGSDEDLTNAREPENSKELQNELDVNAVADVVVSKTKTKRKKRKEPPVTTDDSTKEVEKIHEPQTVEESSDRKQRILRDSNSKTYNEDDKENEILDVEAADNRSKQEKRKRKKKIRDKLEDVNEQNLDIQDERSVPTGNEESIDDSLSRETDSRKILSRSPELEPARVGPTDVKKGKRNIPKDTVSDKDAAWNTGAIQEAVWQEAMREEPLASSETIYDAMKQNDANAPKKSKSASSKDKKRKGGLARDGFPTDQISSEFTGDEISQTNNWIDLHAADVPATSHPSSRPIKETDIDDEIANWENYANSASMTDEKFQSFDMKTPDREHRTMETSVDDIMDEIEDVKEVVAEKVAALYHRSNELNIPPSSGDVPLHISTGAGKQTPIETNIDDEDYEENPPYPEAEEFESAVEKSLETNIDDFIEEFPSVPSKENSIGDFDRYNHLNVKDPAATSRASKVTNIDDFQIEALSSEQLGQTRQSDTIVSSTDDANFTNDAPVYDDESSKIPLRRRGSKKKGQKVEKPHKPEERVDVTEPKDEEALESTEIVPHSTRIPKGQKKKKDQNRLEESSRQENREELLGKRQHSGKQQRPAKETSIDDDIYLSCEDELKSVNEQVTADKYLDDKNLLRQEMDKKAETNEDRESYLDQRIIIQDKKQKKIADYLKIKRFEESEDVESETDLPMDVERTPKTFNLGTDGTKKLKKNAHEKRNKEAQQEDSEKLGLDDEYRRQKKTKKHNKEAAHVHDQIASDVELPGNEEKNSLTNMMDYTETAVDEAAEDTQGMKKKQEQTEETYHEDSEQDEDWGEKGVSSDKDWQETIIPEDIQSKKVASAKSQLERFIPSDEGEDDIAEDAKYNEPKTFSLNAADGKKLRGKSATTEEQKIQQAEPAVGDDYEEYKRGKKTKKHRKEVDNTVSKKEKSYEEEEEGSVLSGKDSKKIPVHEESANIQEFKKKGKQTKDKDFTETGEYTQEGDRNKLSHKKFPSVTKPLEKFIPNDSSEDDEEEKEGEGNTSKTFIPGNRKTKNLLEKALPEDKKGTELLSSDEFEEYKRNRKTKKHPKGMVNPADEKLDKKTKVGSEREVKKFDKLKTVAKQDEDTVITEAGQDEDWREDKIRDVRSEKFNAVKKELHRFSISDESEEEEDEDEVEDVEHKPESFGKDLEHDRRLREKPSAAQEAESVEENEQYQRHKKPKRPALKTLYDQDVSEENEKISLEEAEKFPQKDNKEIDQNRATERRKDTEHKKSQKFGSAQEERDESSSDEQEFEEKKQKTIPSVRRYEEATASDESEDNSQGEEKSTPKSFHISAATGLKKSEKNIVANKNEVMKSVKDEPADDDLQEFQRRKKPKRPAAKAGPTETNIDDDLDERELESTQRKPSTIQTNLDEFSTDEEPDDEKVPVLQQKLDKIKKVDKEFVSDDENDEEMVEEEEEEEEDNVPKTFIIGDKHKQKITEKQAAKDMKKEVDRFAVTEDDSIRKPKKAQNQAADDIKNKMSWKTKTESETDEESDEDRTEYDKLPKKRFEISRFKEDSSFSEESDDNQENVNVLPDTGILPVQISDKKTKMQKNSVAKQGDYSNTRIESKKENEGKTEESNDDELEEEIEEIRLKKNIKEVGRNNERNLKHRPVAKNVGRTSQSQEDDEEESEETSNKEVESEDAKILEHRRRTKSTRDRHANKAAPDVQKGGLHFAAASQQQKIVSETNIDNSSGSDYSGKHDEKITAKIESMLSSHKKPFRRNEDDVESDDPSLIKDDDIARLVETSSKETSKQVHRLKENAKKNLQETSIDDDEIPYYSQRKTQNVREVNGLRENLDVAAKKLQERNKQEKRTFETDDSEEVGESFSRNQLGRVSRVRQKKGTRKTIAAVDASSNADTEGDSTEDGRRRSAGVPSSKKWTTAERNRADTEITDESASCQTSTPNSASISQKPPPSISPLSDNDSPRRDGRFKGKTHDSVKSKVPAGVPKADGDASNDLDLDASIRQKRRMEMTETVETTTTTTTNTKPDSKTTSKQTDESLYSLPNRSNRQPPKLRDIQPMSTTSGSTAKETTFDYEPLPGTSRSKLDMSLPENLLSKNESLKRTSLEASLLRKSTTGEKTSQDRTTRQISAESQNRSRSSEFEGKTHSDANLIRRRPHSTRSRSTSNLDSRVSYNGLYRTQREAGQRAFSMRQPNKSLTEVAFETIAANSVSERHLLKKILSEKPVVYTRGIYRPQPVYWRGSSRGANPNDESRISNRPDVEPLGVNESYAVNDDAQNKTGDSLDISRQNGVLESSLSSPPQLSASRDGDGDDSEKRNSAFAAYNKRVTIHEDQQQQQRQFYAGNRRRHRQHRSSRSPHRPESYKAPRITEPNAVDFSKYGLVAQIWMEQVDMKTVLKSKTMYLTIMPEGVQPPDKITKSLKYEPTGDDLTLPPQWIIARGRTFRQQKRQLDEYRYRMSEGHNLSDSDLDLSRSGRPMSPGGRQELLFFKVGGRWPELAWVLFEGVQTDSATVRMVKDIQLKNPSKLTDQIQDMMTRWWKQKGEAATIEELKRSLDIINIPFIQDETFNPRHASSFFEEEPKLMLEEVDSRDPDVSRMIQEYNLNASFHADQGRSPHTPQAFSSDALLQQTQLRGLETHSSPNLRHSRLRTRTSEGHDDSQSRSDSKDESVARLNARNASFRPFSSQDSLDAENLGDGKRKSFTIVQSKPKNKGKKEKFGHESNI